MNTIDNTQGICYNTLKRSVARMGEDTVKRNKRQREWAKQYFEKFTIQAKIGTKDKLKEIASERNMSLAGLLTAIANKEIPLG